jgi:ABC-type multidrug transport system fused ATPase/permease subunit
LLWFALFAWKMLWFAKKHGERAEISTFGSEISQSAVSSEGQWPLGNSWQFSWIPGAGLLRRIILAVRVRLFEYTGVLNVIKVVAANLLFGLVFVVSLLFAVRGAFIQMFILLGAFSTIIIMTRRIPRARRQRQKRAAIRAARAAEIAAAKAAAEALHRERHEVPHPEEDESKRQHQGNE